ncbi:MAG: (2Fe-2S)-binding protein [Deltaproteobacteria bacterium]|nr:(2Fe-2S)-binding protein [Deltaproteobacteria bacterium]
MPDNDPNVLRHRLGAAAGQQARSEARDVRVVAFTLNGESVQVAAPAHWTLLEALRYRLGLIGTKQGCDKGDCGACTVRVDGEAVLSCLTLAVMAAGRRVETVEGLGVGRPHPLQRAFDDCGAAQCGFCTPGMLMSAAAMLDQARAAGRTLSRMEIAAGLGGNLCRCTGYVRILDAVEQAQRELGGGGER